MGSVPPSEDGGDGWAALPRTRRVNTTGQPQLSRRDRQQAYLMQDIAKELERAEPGTIHRLDIAFSRPGRMQASIVFNRDRGSGGGGALQQSSGVDSAPSSRGRQGRGRGAGQLAPRHAASTNEQQGQASPRPMNSAQLGARQPGARAERSALPEPRERPATVGAIAKDDALIIERTVKSVITPIVRALGGSDGADGARYLTPAFRLVINGHKTGKIKVPLGCQVALYGDEAAEKFAASLASLYTRQNMPNHQIEKLLKSMLTPKEPAAAMDTQ